MDPYKNHTELWIFIEDDGGWHEYNTIYAIHLKWKRMSGIQNVLRMHVFIKYSFDSYSFSCKIWLCFNGNTVLKSETYKDMLQKMEPELLLLPLLCKGRLSSKKTILSWNYILTFTLSQDEWSSFGNVSAIDGFVSKKSITRACFNVRVVWNKVMFESIQH